MDGVLRLLVVRRVSGLVGLVSGRLISGLVRSGRRRRVISRRGGVRGGGVTAAIGGGALGIGIYSEKMGFVKKVAVAGRLLALGVGGRVVGVVELDPRVVGQVLVHGWLVSGVGVRIISRRRASVGRGR